MKESSSFRFAALASVLFCAAACGPTQIVVDGPQLTDARAAMAGGWTGTWQSVTTLGPRNQNGGLQFTVSPAGEVNGAMTNATVSGNGVLTGTLQADGTFSGEYRFVKGTSRYPTTGVLRTGGGVVRGALSVTAWGVEMASVSFSAVRAR